MEISIFAGCYELLVVGEYLYENGSMTPFLGSSVDKPKLVEEETKIINVPTIALNYIATTRSLNQYMKRRSHQLRGIHCTGSYFKGFYPISAIEYMNYACQKFSRKMENHHFFSSVLHLITSLKAINDEHMEGLWSVFIRLPFYQKLMDSATAITNLIEISTALNANNNNSLLIPITCILGVTQSRVPCFFSLYNEAKAKKIAL